GKDYQFGRKLGGPNRSIADITRQNALFLSVAALSNHDFLGSIFHWFARGVMELDRGPTGRAYMSDLLGRIPAYRQRISGLVRLADLGIEETRLVPAERDSLREQAMPKTRLEVMEGLEGKEVHAEGLMPTMTEEHELQLTHHSVVGATPLPYKEESLGTRACIVLIVYALAALDAGGSLLVDERDASMLPLLMREILRLFSNVETNPDGAQLIFT